MKVVNKFDLKKAQIKQKFYIFKFKVFDDRR